MQKKYLTLMTSLLVIAACSKVADVETPLQEKEFTAYTEDAPFTKTVISGDGTVSFTANDAISIFDDKGEQYKFVAQRIDNTKALFAGQCKAAENYYALYPYNETDEYHDGVFSSTLPAVQEKSANIARTFDPNAVLSVSAINSEGEFHMKNVCSLLRVTFDDIVFIDHIELRAEGDRNLAGPFIMFLDSNNEPTIRNGNGVKTVTVNCLDNHCPKGDAIYISVFPGNYYRLELNVYLVGEDTPRYTMKSRSSVNLDRAGIYAFPQIQTGVEGMDIVDFENLNGKYFIW